MTKLVVMMQAPGGHRVLFILLSNHFLPHFLTYFCLFCDYVLGHLLDSGSHRNAVPRLPASGKPVDLYCIC